MKISKKVQMWIVIGVVVIVALYGFFGYIYIPLDKAITQSFSELQDKKSKLENARTVAKQYDLAKFKGEQLIKLQQYLQGKLPDTLSYPALINEITQLMADSRVSYTGINPPRKTLRRDAGGIGYNAICMDMNISTNFNNFCHLLSNLRVSPIPLAAFVTTIQYDVTKPKISNLRITMTLLAYTTGH